MIGKIILAADGSEHAARATDLAAELSDRLNAELFIVHVLMHGRPSAELVRMVEIEHLVKQAHATAFPGVRYVPGSYLGILNAAPAAKSNTTVIAAIGDQIVTRARSRCLDLGARIVETSVHAGDSAEGILAAAKEYAADMIVIGSRGLGALSGPVLGSVSHKVLQHAECAVLTVK